MIRVQLPANLRALAKIDHDVAVDVSPPVTIRAIVDALEEQYPSLKGTIRDHGTLKRRPMVRFFACERDWSHASPDDPLPDEIVSGKEPFLIVGAISGG